MNSSITQNTDFHFFNSPYIMEGQVIDTSDPDQMGRVRVWIPAIDGENFDPNILPWAEYASPFFGFTVEMPAGEFPVENKSHAAYGMWAIPKIGASVLVFFLNGNTTRRFYFASVVRLHRNRSLPAGRNIDFNGNRGPFGDAGDGQGNLEKIEPAYTNLREQFQNQIDSSQALTRGAYERQVAEAGENKTGKEGYSETPLPSDSYLDPQTYCWVTPGRNAIIMQDDPKVARFRIKTAEGHQIIFDDANERIYISTSRGKTWVELDQDGHIHVFGSQSISVRAGEDINLYADRDVNIEAGRAIHAKALTGDIRLDTGASIHTKAVKNISITACGNMHITSENLLRMTSSKNMDILSREQIAMTSKAAMHLKGSTIIETGGPIHLNGPVARTAKAASCAEPAQEPPIVPGHEPWDRPATKGQRGPNWKK